MRTKSVWLWMGLMMVLGQRALALPILLDPDDGTVIYQLPPSGRGSGAEIDVCTWANLAAFREYLETEKGISPDFAGSQNFASLRVDYGLPNYVLKFNHVLMEMDGITSGGPPLYGCDGIDPMEWVDASVNAVLPPPYVVNGLEYTVRTAANTLPHVWFADCQEPQGVLSPETETMLRDTALNTRSEGEDEDDLNEGWGCSKVITDENGMTPEQDPKDPSCEDPLEKGGGSGSPSVTLPGAGLPMTLRFLYNSRYGTPGEVVHAGDPDNPDRHIRRYDVTGSLGLGWTHSFDMVMRKTRKILGAANYQQYYWWDILENDGTGREVGFGHWETQHLGNWDHIPTEKWQSCAFENGEYVLVTKGNTVYTFQEHDDPPDPDEMIEPVKRYEISSIEDRYGNRLLFTYQEVPEARDLLVTVLNEKSGRQFNFVDDNADGQVDRITFPYPEGNPDNETWTLTYDAEYNRLIKVDLGGPDPQNREYEAFEYVNPETSILAVDNDGDEYVVDLPQWAVYTRADNMTQKTDARGVGTVYEYSIWEDAVVGTSSTSGRLYKGRKEEFAWADAVRNEYLDFWIYDGEELIGRTRHARRPWLNPIGAWQHGNRNADKRGSWVDYETREEWIDEKGETPLEWGDETPLGFKRSTYEDYGWDYEPYLFLGTDENGNLSGADDTLPLDWPTCRQDVFGRKTHTTYWHGDRTDVEYGKVKHVRSPDGLISYTEYDPVFARPAWTALYHDSDPNTPLTETTRTYDANGNLETVTVPSGTYENPTTVTTSFSYFQDGSVETITDPKNRSVSYTYKPNGDLDSITRTATLYDLDGNPTPVALETEYHQDGMGRVWKVVDPVDRDTVYERDHQGRIVKTILPMASSTGEGNIEVSQTYDLSGNLKTVTNPLNDTVVYEYGQDNELLSATIPVDEERSATTSYGFDERLRLTWVMDGEERMTQYFYDSLDRLTSVRDPLTRETQYAFDIADRLIERLDARGLKTQHVYEEDSDRLHQSWYLDEDDTPLEVLEFGYDLLGRRTSVLSGDGSGPGQVVEEVAYDPASRPVSILDCCGREKLFGYDEMGNRVDFDFVPDGGTGGFHVDYTLDDLDRVISMTRTQGTDTKEVRYSYNQAGDLVGVRYPNGSEIHYEHDSLGRVTTLENVGPLGELLSTFGYAYDDASRRIKIEREDGTYTSYGYNRAGWLVRETRMDSMGTEPEGDDELLWQDEYSYDLAGNRTEKAHTEALGGGEFEITIQRYKYNHANQLVLEWKETGYLGQGTVAGEVWDEESGLAKLTLNGVTPSTWGSYFYGTPPASSGQVLVLAEDHVKNQTLIPVQVNASLTDFVSYTYDENGNLVEKLSADGPTLYQWDHRNRLTKVVHPDGQETTYEYCPACPLGKLSKMTRTDGSTVEWVWDGIGFLREVDSQDALPMEYFGGVSVKKNGAWYYLHMDVMGTVWQVTDEAGQVVNEFNWDAWGNELSGTFGQPGALCQIGWQGKRWDQDQGIFYSVARWYDQGLGRFTQPDPAEGDGALGRGPGYRWPLNLPVHRSDPTGSFAYGGLRHKICRKLCFDGLTALLDELTFAPDPKKPEKTIPVPRCKATCNDAIDDFCDKFCLHFSSNDIPLLTKIRDLSNTETNDKQRLVNTKTSFSFLEGLQLSINLLPTNPDRPEQPGFTPEEIARFEELMRLTVMTGTSPSDKESSDYIREAMKEWLFPS